MRNPFSKIIPEPAPKRKVTLLPISDIHSGGSTALFPHYNELQNGYWQFKHMRYVPSGKQCDMAKHFDYCADKILEKRDGNQLVIVSNGDMIDGAHHNTLQLATHNLDEQMDVYVWLMQRFFKRVGFDKSKGDKFYVVSGSETHTAEKEDLIAKELGAEQNPDGGDLFDFLPLDINGKLFWFLHQGAGPGKGANMGNALHNWMRNKYFELMEANERIPDGVIMGHYHVPLYDTYTRNHKTMHGWILPSFQLKTRFGYKVAAAELERIGIYSIDVSANGEIIASPPMVMAQRNNTVYV